MTIDPDVEALLHEAMRKQGISFKAALNQAVRLGLIRAPAQRRRTYRLKTHRMGYRPEIQLDQALALAAALEDEEIARKLSLRK